MGLSVRSTLNCASTELLMIAPMPKQITGARLGAHVTSCVNVSEAADHVAAVDRQRCRSDEGGGRRAEEDRCADQIPDCPQRFSAAFAAIFPAGVGSLQSALVMSVLW